MAAELREGVAIEAKLIEGGGGIFDVTVNGKLVYSKGQTGRFPEPGEVLALVKDL